MKTFIYCKDIKSIVILLIMKIIFVLIYSRGNKIERMLERKRIFHDNFTGMMLSVESINA